ncbi:hypothetical protein [Methylocystis sp.]|uniref:hypothetical protein n=1 Tax=Methylocystis sp. TaxID=1911079 RepID=UPI003DA52F93
MVDRTLHLVGGESASEQVMLAGIAGKIYSIDDIMMEGPVPNGLSSDSDWQFRAQVIEQIFRVPADRYLKNKASREQLLCRISDFDETVFWFEQSLFCQINFLQFFAWLADRVPFSTKLSIAAWNMDSVGRLNAERSRELFAQRKPASGALFKLSKVAWAAYCAPDPLQLATLVRQHDFSAWPELRGGLEMHMKRFPGETRLNFLETSLLEFIEEMGPAGASIIELVGRFFTEPRTRGYGLGDIQIIAHLNELAQSPSPLITQTSSGADPSESNLMNAVAFRVDPVTAKEPMPVKTKFVLTPRGRTMLAGNREEEFERHTVRWLGGVHLENGPDHWRWDHALGLVAGID